MKLKITYPPVEKRKLQRRHLLRIIRWPVLFAVVMSPVVNYILGGKAWSLIVLMSIYMAWSLVLSPDLVEYNRISQSIKLISFSCSLLAMIDFFLSPGWAIDVVPIVLLRRACHHRSNVLVQILTDKNTEHGCRCCF